MSHIYHSDRLSESFLATVRVNLERTFADCETLAVKLHFGEPENPYTFQPEDIEPVTRILQDLHLDYFLFDSPVTYGGPRGNVDSHKELARQLGWNELGAIRTKNDFVTVEGENMQFEVCSQPGNADGVLVVNHFKGHICSGFGGAIKNLGMGGLTKNSKNAIHNGGSPEVVGECTQCGACEEVCPVEAITVNSEPAVNGDLCVGCSKCIIACTEDTLRPSVNYFDELLADGAHAAQSTYNKYYYITYIRNIAAECDCELHPSGIIAGDAGYLVGKDGVAIDQAAFDVVRRQEKQDVFLRHNNKSGTEQVQAASALEMGSPEYDLITV